MNDNIISWTFANWVSVILMAAVGFAILGFAQKLWQSNQQNQAA